MHRSRTLAVVASLVLLLLAPVRAGESELFVRVVQVKGTGTRKGDKKPAMDKALEPFRAHLEQASQHAHYAILGQSATKKGPPGKPISFDLENKLRAEATPSLAGDKKIKLVLQVTKRGEKDKKDELVFETTFEMKDAATTVPRIDGQAAGGDLLLAITASRESL